jgi:hypothetical protein
MLRHCNPILSTARISIIALSALCVLASAAHANLNPGDTQYNPVLNAALTPKYTSSAAPEATYNIPVTTLTSNYNYVPSNANEAYFGSITTTVRANGAGQLLFEYKLNNLQPPGNVPSTRIDRFTINDPTNPWAGVAITQAGADTSGLSTPVTTGPFGSWANGQPFSYQRDAVDQGISTNFTFGGSGTQLTSSSNDTSAVLWFTTTATHFRRTDVGLTDTGTVGTANALAPFVPEPSTLILSALGGLLGGLVAVKRRLRQK